MNTKEFDEYVQGRIADHKENTAKSDAEKKMEGKRKVGLCESLNRYSSVCDKCLLYSGLLISFVQGAGMPMMFFVMKGMMSNMGDAASSVGQGVTYGSKA
jgi:hypothetical protein